MKIKPSSMTYWPIYLTIVLIIWTMIVKPYSKYGDYWAIDPAIILFPIVFIIHIIIMYKKEFKMKYVIYSLVHLTIFFSIWLMCLALISKDSI